MSPVANHWWPLVFCALTLSACDKSREPPAPAQAPCPEVSVGTPVDPMLVAFLGRARAAHHAADIREQRGDLEGAIRVLSELLAPAKVPQRAEAREVLADTRARLADYKSQLGRFADAALDVQAGMQLAQEPTYFRGHLFEVQGLVAERQAKQLKADGNQQAAQQAEARALDAFEKAMQVQEQVIDQALPDTQ